MENLEKIANLSFALADNGRILMIDVIMEHSGEEFENKDDYLRLAKDSDLQLRYRLKSIIDYYIEEIRENKA